MNTKIVNSLLILTIISIGLLSCDVWNDNHFIRKIPNQIEFKEKLTDYNLFKGDIKELIPNDNGIIYELATPLFTDYASKQRIIYLKDGTKMKANQDGSLTFPDSTILAKTFYYNSSENEKLILETRLLYFLNNRWNVAVYEWNNDQNEAYLITSGKNKDINVLIKDKNTSFSYSIPSNNQCTTCHQVNYKTLPIGPKISNLSVYNENLSANQISHWVLNGYLDTDDLGSTKQMPNWSDQSESLHNRARAYLDVNCAHCHIKGGVAEYTDLYLDYQLPLNNTYITAFNDYILYRMEIENSRETMPKIGTNLKHKEGIELIYQFIQELK